MVVSSKATIFSGPSSRAANANYDSSREVVTRQDLVSFLENPAENLRHCHQWIKDVGSAPLPHIRNRPDVPPVSLGSRTRSPSRTTTQRGSCCPWVPGDCSCPESTPTFYLMNNSIRPEVPLWLGRRLSDCSCNNSISSCCKPVSYTHLTLPTIYSV